jgi:hypothetical protein
MVDPQPLVPGYSCRGADAGVRLRAVYVADALRNVSPTADLRNVRSTTDRSVLVSA